MKLKIAIMSLLASTILSAASIDYLSNNSASFFQNPSQTGKISVENTSQTIMQEPLHLTFYIKKIDFHYLEMQA